MKIILIILLVIYMSVNIYHDVRTLKTKNLWHLLFAIIFVGWNITGHTGQTIYLLLLSMIFGLTLERFNQQLPGDTKMLVVCSQALFSITVLNPYAVVVILYFIKMITSSIWGFTRSYRKDKEQFTRDIKEMVLAPFFPALRYSIAGQTMYSHAGAPFYLIASAIIIGINYTIVI